MAEPGVGTRGRLLHLARYALAGGATSLVYIVVYNLAVQAGMVRFFASNLGYAAALLFQYFAHGRYTFGHRTPGAGVWWRYLVSVGFGFILAALVSEANTKLYTLPDTVVSVIVMVLVAISNFVLFNLWVYRDRPAPEPGRGEGT
jgi:putative flippase GtrA